MKALVEFEKTIFGVIENQAEDQARATAAGHLTEAFLQLYGGTKIAMNTLGPAIQYASMKARQLAPALVNAVKTNRYGKTVDNVNLTKAASKAKQLNKPNGFDKFGNYTFGIKEHIIFPEVSFDRADKVRGLDIVIVIKAINKEHSFALLEKMNFPFIKKGDN